MMKSLLLGTILGGIAAFIWSTISWTVLSWHAKSVLHFQNEDEVSAVIASHAPQSGMYLVPAGPSEEGMTPEQRRAAQAAAIGKMQKGPIMFAAVRRGGFGSYANGLIIQFLSLMAAAFLLTWLLLQTSGLTYARRVLFLAVTGLAASVIVNLPDWNWWGFSGVYTVVNLADFTLMWLFAGLLIAKVANPPASSAAR
jgi:hypothetical protein